jgi:hypothetical protein
MVCGVYEGRNGGQMLSLTCDKCQSFLIGFQYFSDDLNTSHVRWQMELGSS